MSEPFYGSRLKIERAKQHINNLHEMILAFAVDSYVLSVHSDGKIGYDVVQVDTAKSLPDNFALVIGDALHNLKSALDFIVNEVVFRRLGYYDDFTRFPFRKTRNDLVAAVNGGLIHQASKAVADFIVDVVKPYNGGNDALWALHDLNILDKHRLLLPFMQITAVHDILAEDDRGEKISIGTWVITNNRTAIYPCVGHSNVKITNKGKSAFLVLFDQGLPLESKAVIPHLKQMAELVSGVVEGIETVFAGEE
jgi:hypothetical protein